MCLKQSALCAYAATSCVNISLIGDDFRTEGANYDSHFIPVYIRRDMVTEQAPHLWQLTRRIGAGVRGSRRVWQDWTADVGRGVWART